jgi:hypothetical protein
MPKIVVTVPRKLATRSKTVAGEEKHPEGANDQTPRENKKSSTPNRSGSKGDKKVKIEEERRIVKASERKFFTVGEDHQIITVLKSLGDSKTSREIAETISKKMNHSVESIRDRIKRFLTRIRPVDEAYIAEEAKVLSKLFFAPPRIQLNCRTTPTTTSTSQRRTRKGRGQCHT